MKKIILSTIGIATAAIATWLMLSSFIQPVADEDPVTPRSEIRNYVKEHIWPVLTIQREKLNSYLSPDELKKVETLKAGQAALRQEMMETFKSRRSSGFPKRDGQGPQFTPEQKETMRSHMMTRGKIRAEAYAIAAAHQKEIFALIDELDYERSEWRSYMHNIFLKFHEQRGFGKPGQGRGQGMGPQGMQGMQGMQGNPGQGRWMNKGRRTPMGNSGRGGFGFMQLNNPVNFLLFDPENMGQFLENSSNSMGLFYPNPAGDIIKIKLQIEKAQQVTVKLFDSQGNQLAIILQEKKEAGTHIKEYDVSNLKSGVYFYEIVMGEQVIKRRFVKN